MQERTGGWASVLLAGNWASKGWASIGVWGALAVMIGVVLRLVLRESGLNATQARVVMGSDVLLACVLAWVIVALARAWRGRMNAASMHGRWALFAVLFVVFACPLVLWFVGEYPGHLASDQLQIALFASRREVHPFLSSAYGLWAAGVSRVFGFFAAIAIINIALVSWVLADIFSLMVRHGLRRWIAGVFVVLLATSIPLGLSAINYSHDILAAFLLLALVAMVLRAAVAFMLSDEPADAFTLFTIGGLGIAVACLRGEGLGLVAAIPLALLLTRSARWWQAGAVGAGVLLGLIVFRAAVEPPMLTAEWTNSDYKNKYKLTLVLNPIGFMLNNHYISLDPAADRAALEAVVGWDRMIYPHYSPLHIGVYWGNVHSRVTDEKWKGVAHVFTTSAVNNPALFVGNRATAFLACLGVNRSCTYPFLDNREQRDPAQLYIGQEAELRRLGLTLPVEPGPIGRVTHRLRDWSLPGVAFPNPGFLLWNAWPALALTLLLVWLTPRRRIAGACALLIAIPLSLIFAAVGQAMFKYITGLYVFGFLAVPLLVFDLTLSRRGASDAPRSAPVVA